MSSERITLGNWGGETQTGEDMAKKFNGCYILAKFIPPENEEPATSVISIQTFDDPYVHFHSYHSGKDYKGKREDVQVLKALPEPGVYSLSKGVALVRRWPARQWHEGLCRGNTHILFNGVDALNGPMTQGIAENLFAPQQDVSLKVGLELLKPGTSLRLDSRLWLKSLDKDRTELYSMVRRIGSWSCGDFFWARANTHSARICQDEVRERLGSNAAI